ncbi:MAG: hypothetical protein ACRCZZ_06825 [Phocaeicola sp.]
MKLNVFKTQCKEGSRVLFDGDAGVVVKKSQSESKALIAFENGDKNWIDYTLIELV